jgi:signal transduction histidine kinase
MNDRSFSKQEARTTLLFLLVLLALANGMAWFMYRRSLALLEEDLGRHLVSIGKAIALQVEGDVRAASPGLEPGGAVGERLGALLDVYELDNLAILSPDLEVLARARGEMPASPDPFVPERADLDQIAPALAGEPVHTSLYRVGGETFKSAYVPVFANGGDVKALVAVDASASFLGSAGLLRQILLALSAASVVLAGIAALFFRRTVRAILRLEQTRQHQEKLSALGTMAAGVAHEVRNPLGIIRATAEMLAESETATDRRAMLDSIVAEVDRMNRLLSNVLAFSRPAKEEPRVYDVGGTLRECLQAIQADFARQGITLSAELSDLPRAKADPEEARQIFLNLLLNARDAMPSGGSLRVSARDRTIAPAAGTRAPRWFARGNGVSRAPHSAVEGRFVEVQVADTGAGMSKEIQGRVLDPFFTTKPGGTGLGLSVVHGIVTGSGGYLEIESKSGRGTTVRVGFPAAAS